jgi:electron-transferring-flavoprotein dehydrogenase
MSEERESLDLDVVFVGAGPASLAGAIRLGQLVEKHNRTDGNEPLELSIAVLEKAQEVSGHAISGAVVDPRALRELFPHDWRDAPLEGEVQREELWWMTGRRALSLPIPPMLENEGKYVASLGKLAKWMAEKAEEVGVDVFCEFPASEVLLDGERVTGVRTADRGLDRDGNRKANFEPGIDIHSRAVVLGEGPRGTLSKQLDERLGLSRDSNPQTYAIGIKEVWEIPEGRLETGDVIHTMGWPLDSSTFGGGFVYKMQGDLLIVGLVVGLDYRNPLLDPHQEFQRLKTHPRIAGLLDGGQMRYYGAKAIPEGGWWAMPQLSGDGFLVIGDSAGFLNSQRLKGVHLAMKSGMLAAETVFNAILLDDTSAATLGNFGDAVRQSWAGQELWEVRNFHQAFDHGALAGMLQAGLGMLTDGRGFGIFDRLRSHPGHTRMQRRGDATPQPQPVAFDGQLTFDKLADVYNSATAHEEDQPVHLHVADTDICVHQCAVEYDNPCQRFCPAGVYEMVADGQADTGQRLQINASNCVHCKTCDIMDPYQIITWVPPVRPHVEGGCGWPKHSANLHRPGHRSGTGYAPPWFSSPLYCSRSCHRPEPSLSPSSPSSSVKATRAFRPSSPGPAAPAGSLSSGRRRANATSGCSSPTPPSPMCCSRRAPCARASRCWTTTAPAGHPTARRCCSARATPHATTQPPLSPSSTSIACPTRA